MTSPQRIDDRAALEHYLLRDRPLHLYELGDLDPFFWPRTEWWGARDDAGALTSVVLVYRGVAAPTVVALGEPPVAELLAAIEPALPARFHLHAAPGFSDRLSPRRRLAPRGRHMRMLLGDRPRLAAADGAPVCALTGRDLDELQRLYGRAYPQNWFDPRMLDTGHYVGIRERGRLACVAGVHVHSPRYRVAAVGNVTTAPEARGRGLATRATAALCRRLLATVDVIGLNVAATNAAALACYRKLGFSEVATYEEWEVSA